MIRGGHLQPSEEHLADAEVHLKLVKAHLAVLEPVEQAEADSLEIVSPPTPGLPVGETCSVPAAPRKMPARQAKTASAAGKGSSSGEPEVGLAQKGRAPLEGAEEASPPKAGEKWACPVNDCRESATHPLDNCKGFEDLSITKRRKMLREWSRCECCLTDCRDRETGARCYRRIGFRRHHLLRLAVQQEVTSARDSKRQEEQPRGEAAGADQTSRDVPPKRSRRTGGEQERGKNQRARPQKRVATWCFPAFARNKELVWLRATESHHVGVTRIRHQAAMRLGLPQSVTEAYRVRLRLSDKPQFVLRAEGVETLECVRPKNERDNSRVLKPDVIVGWADRDKVQLFVMSGWMIPGQVPPGATTPATKWHLRMNLRGSPPVYLNVQLDPMRKRTTITHEAAVRIGETFHSFYLLFVRTEAGEVGSLVAAGADAIVRANRRRPAGQAERGPDILLDATGTRNMVKYLRAGWRSEEEIGGRSGCPISGQWHGKLNAVRTIRDPGWTCVEYVRTGRSERDSVMRVMFDTIREQTIIRHSVAVKLGLSASGGPAWLGHRGEDQRYSSCRYMVPVLDWKGRSEWIEARGVSYTTPSERRDAPEGAREAFPENAWEDLKGSQGEGPVDMIIVRDNPEWMPVPMQEEPYERFTLMWTT